MDITIELLAGSKHEPPSKSDMDKNIDAIDRALKKANAADTNLLSDTRSILIAIQNKLPEYRR